MCRGKHHRGPGPAAAAGSSFSGFPHTIATMAPIKNRPPGNRQAQHGMNSHWNGMPSRLDDGPSRETKTAIGVPSGIGSGSAHIACLPVGPAAVRLSAPLVLDDRPKPLAPAVRLVPDHCPLDPGAGGPVHSPLAEDQNTGHKEQQGHRKRTPDRARQSLGQVTSAPAKTTPQDAPPKMKTRLPPNDPAQHPRAARPISLHGARRAVGNKLRGRVSCSTRLGL